MTGDAVGLFLIILVAIVTFAAIRYPNYGMAVVSGGVWAMLIPYIKTNGIMTNGSTEQEMLILVISGIALVLLISGVMRSISNKREERSQADYYYSGGEKGAEPKHYTAYMRAKNRDNEAVDEPLELYRARIRAKARPWEGRRNGR